jgi:hypothetical protein
MFFPDEIQALDAASALFSGWIGRHWQVPRPPQA